MTDRDDPARATTKTWTTTYRMPIAIVSGVLGMLCFWALFDGSPAEKWVGGVGLVVLIVWVFVFQAFYRRGY
ncbi:hypothetical protein ACLBWP_13665 [Microbacterium sp. M1A1_1b]